MDVPGAEFIFPIGRRETEATGHWDGRMGIETPWVFAKCMGAP